MIRNENVYTMAQDWIRWLDTRRFFGEPAQQNILAQMMRDKEPSRGEPDAKLSPEMCAFNMAVCSLPVGMFVPFVAIYCEHRPKPIKTMADELGIQAPAFYDRAHGAAGDVASTTRQLLKLSRQMRAELYGLHHTK